MLFSQDLSLFFSSFCPLGLFCLIRGNLLGSPVPWPIVALDLSVVFSFLVGIVREQEPGRLHRWTGLSSVLRGPLICSVISCSQSLQTSFVFLGQGRVLCTGPSYEGN
jgi:hypothetical protein